MTDADKNRFLDVLRWLCKRYKVNGEVRPLPVGEDLTEYFQALRNLPIEDLEHGARWHYANSEFYPTQPASLRKSVESWRLENPKPLSSVSAASRLSWLNQIDRSGESEVDTSFSSKMGELFEELTLGRITVEEHMQKLKAICDDAGMDCP